MGLTWMAAFLGLGVGYPADVPSFHRRKGEDAMSRTPCKEGSTPSNQNHLHMASSETDPFQGDGICAPGKRKARGGELFLHPVSGTDCEKQMDKPCQNDSQWENTCTDTPCQQQDIWEERWSAEEMPLLDSRDSTSPQLPVPCG